MVKFIRRALLTIISLLILSLIIVGIFVNNTSVEGLKPKVNEALANLCGLPLFIRGQVELVVLPNPVLKVHDVVIYGDNELSLLPLFATSEIQLHVSLPSLLSGDLEVTEVTLSDGEMNIITDLQGRGNWMPQDPAATELRSRDAAVTFIADDGPLSVRQEAENAEADNLAGAGFSISLAEVNLQKVNVERFRINKLLKVNNESNSFSWYINSFSAERGSSENIYPIDSLFIVDPDMGNNGTQVTLAGLLEMEESRWRFTSNQLSLKAQDGTLFYPHILNGNMEITYDPNIEAGFNKLNLSSDALKFESSGKFEFVNGNSVANGQFNLTAKPADLGVFAETTVPASFRVSSNYNWKESILKLTELKGRADNADFSGTGDIMLPGAKGVAISQSANIKMNLRMSDLNITSLFGVATKSPRASQKDIPVPNLRFARTKIDFVVNLSSLSIGNETLKNVKQATLKVDKERLSVTPTQLRDYVY